MAIMNINFAAAESETGCRGSAFAQWPNARRLGMINTLTTGFPPLPRSDFKVFLSCVSMWLNRRLLVENLPQRNRL